MGPLWFKIEQGGAYPASSQEMFCLGSPLSTEQQFKCYLLNQWMLTCYSQPPFDPLYVYFYNWKRKYMRYNLGCESNEGSKVGWCTLEWTGKHLIWILKSFQHLTEVKITRVVECSLHKHFEANEYWTGEIEGILKQMNGGVERVYALLWVWSELWHPAELKFWKSIWKVGSCAKCRLSFHFVKVKNLGCLVVLHFNKYKTLCFPRFPYYN